MIREGFSVGSSASADSVGSTVLVGSRSVYIEKKLADGGYAVVYLAHDTYNQQPYALKRVLIRDKEHELTVMQEVNIWRKLGNHPNIVAYIDGSKGVLSNGNKVFWILCELCTGGHLVDLMEKYGGALQEKQCLYILREAARGIKLMHEQHPPIAHRDIKVENILLSGKQFKLCDFGSATARRLNRLEASEDDIFEAYEEYEKYTTMMYRPPEMCDRYLNFNVSEKADIWMLGCVAFTIAFARHPFEEQQKLAIINSRYIMGDGVTDKYKDLIRFMLTPNPQERPSIAQVLVVLENWELSTISLSPAVRKIKQEQEQRETERFTPKDHERDLTEDQMYKLKMKILAEQQRKEAKKLVITPNQSNMQSLIKQSMLMEKKGAKRIPQKPKKVVQAAPSYDLFQAAAKPPAQQKVTTTAVQHHNFADFSHAAPPQTSHHAFDFGSQGFEGKASADPFNFSSQPPAVTAPPPAPPVQTIVPQAGTAAAPFDAFKFDNQPAAVSSDPFGFGGGVTKEASDPTTFFGQSEQTVGGEGLLLEFGGEEETTRPLSILEQLGGVDFGSQG